MATVGISHPLEGSRQSSLIHSVPSRENSPRTIRLNNSISALEEFLSKAQLFAKNHQENLNEFTGTLVKVAQIQEERIPLEAQLTGLLALKDQVIREQQEVQRQMHDLHSAHTASEQQRTELIHHLEQKDLELDTSSQAVGKYLLLWENARNQLEEEQKKLKKTQEDLEEKNNTIATLNLNLGIRATQLTQQAEKIDLQTTEYKTLQLEKQSTLGLLEQQKLENKQWKEIAAQQKTAVAQRDQLILNQTQRLLSVENISVQNSQIQKQIQGLANSSKPPTQTEKTARKISPIAIALIIAAAIVLAIAIALWLNPHLASASGELARRSLTLAATVAA